METLQQALLGGAEKLLHLRSALNLAEYSTFRFLKTSELSAVILVTRSRQSSCAVGTCCLLSS